MSSFYGNGGYSSGGGGGSGDARKNALGTRYSNVQNIINNFVKDENMMLNAMADYVIRGLAGNDETRKNNLKGYYTKVQDIINERYKK